MLVGDKPEEVSKYDFKPFTSCLSKFVRRKHAPIEGLLAVETDRTLPDLQWTEGAGIGGGWDCVDNGNCLFLKSGEERGWYSVLNFYRNQHV